MEHKISILMSSNEQLSVQEFKNRNLNYHNALGIILQTPVLGVVVSFDCFEEQWGETGKLITSEKGDSQNLMNLSGAALTKGIVDFQQTNDMTDMSAAKRCWGYHCNFGGVADSLQWYLPSAYELCTICAFKDEIRSVMVEVGITDEEMLNFDGWFWSSSEYSSSSAVYVYFGSGSLGNGSKTINLYVRAVSAFRPLEIFNTLTCELCEQGTFGPQPFSDSELVDELKRRGFSGTITKTFEL